MAFAKAIAPYELESQPALSRAGRVAVVLNKNAKRVTPKVRDQIAKHAPDTADIFYTESLEQARFVVRRIVDSGYQTIVTGGGDGTVVNTIDEALNRREARGYSHCPRFAILKLGTGNAIADFLGAGAIKNDLAAVEMAPVRWLDLMRINGKRTTFAGFGWDAQILNDYDRMKSQAEKFEVSRALFKTVTGYLATAFLKSVPELVASQSSWNIRIVNTGDEAFRLGENGRVLERFGRGAVVYEGKAAMGCVGTTPYYGYKLNIMPWADKTAGMFQFRVIDMHPLQAVQNLRKCWNGTLQDPGVHDFHLSSCHVEIEGEAPFQVAGDGEGSVSELDISLEHPIRCAQFGH